MAEGGGGEELAVPGEEEEKGASPGEAGRSKAGKKVGLAARAATELPRLQRSVSGVCNKNVSGADF